MSQPSNEPIEGGERRPTTRPDPLGGVPDPRPAPWWAWGLLGFLFLANVLASVDRWLFTALIRPLGLELDLWEDQADWLETLPLIAAALAAPALGFFGDRMRRPRLLALGIAVFGLASVGTGLASSFGTLQRARALVGVGTATFGVVALTMLMDLFPRTARARVLAVYFLAGPVGAATALGLGPALADVTTWQTAFLFAGAPALVLAMASLTLPDPVRGVSEGVAIPRLRRHEAEGASGEDYVDLMVNSSFTYAVFGLTFTGFAIGGLEAWLPTFLVGVRKLSEPQAAIVAATLPPAAAAVGLLAGGWLADRWARTDPRAYFLVPAAAAFLAAPLWLVMALGPARPWQFGVLFAVVALLAANLGPCHAILASVAAPNMRGVAFGSALTVSHLLGDAWGPRLMAWAAEVFGQADAMATPFGRALAALGAVPRAVGGRPPENLAAAMLVAAPTLLAAFVVLLCGARHLPGESALMLANLRAAAPRPVKTAPPVEAPPAP
ncbi:MFS transporter [Paludisphaera soli]|uniref:MFS transporter n=1 Tax=Paludisphaera soli TaxID=2712865 RepID=UPI0013E9B9D6|nr:MFS transporter [Paludisphaera soli]